MASFGQHSVLRDSVEKRILGNVSRQGGLPSSRLGLAIVDGTVDTLGVEDVLSSGRAVPAHHGRLLGWL